MTEILTSMGFAAVIGAICGIVHLLYLRSHGEKVSGADDCGSSPESCGHCGCCGKGKHV